MIVAIYGRRFDEPYRASIQTMVRALEEKGLRIAVYKRFFEFLKEKIHFANEPMIFERGDSLAEFKYMLSVGGDGTLLDCANHVRNTGIPILGVNTGRLGFLSNVSCEDVEIAVDAIVSNAFTSDERDLITVSGAGLAAEEFNCALNEVTVHKKDTASMVKVHTFVDDIFVTTYWADGLIVSTPTGSTAYTLSCGGPIVMPGSQNFTLTPIAPHNLNMRPLVISNEHTIKLRTDGREAQSLLTLDSRSFSLDHEQEITLKKADFQITLLNLEGQHFFSTIRQKLMWGMDKRN